MTVTKKASSSDLIDQLLADYQKSEVLLGENGLLKGSGANFAMG